MISTSGGRCFLKATISGVLEDVWPPTMAPTFVATEKLGYYRSLPRWVTLTRSVCCHNLVDMLCFHTVDDVVAFSGDKMAVRKDVDVFASFDSQATQ